MGILIYIILVFAISNIYYALFYKKEEWKSSMWAMLTAAAAILFIIDVFLSLTNSDRLVMNIADFFIFLGASYGLLTLYAFFLLLINRMIAHIVFVKSYGTYIFIFSMMSFFGNFLFAFVLYALIVLIFGIE